jgi:single-stranded-DNA-specific exonuclease
VVIAANTGFRPGYVHFAARTATGTNLIEFFAQHRPPGADEGYGNGHAQASGGALRRDDWNSFAASIGFPEEALA